MRRTPARAMGAVDGDGGRTADLAKGFPARCRASGLHLTPQRQAIYEALVRTREHPSAERLHEMLRGDYPSLSLATVYKNLEALERVGLVALLNVVHETARYDGETRRHHHLVCERCKSVTDVHDPALDGVAARGKGHGRRAGFQVRDFSIHFYGLCARCAAPPEARELHSASSVRANQTRSRRT